MIYYKSPCLPKRSENILLSWSWSPVHTRAWMYSLPVCLPLIGPICSWNLCLGSRCPFIHFFLLVTTHFTAPTRQLTTVTPFTPVSFLLPRDRSCSQYSYIFSLNAFSWLAKSSHIEGSCHIFPTLITHWLLMLVRVRPEFDMPL